MRIAIPLAEGRLCLHFGHCGTFAIIDLDPEKKEITNREDLVPPAHEPGLLPRWLTEKNVNMIISGGMGQRAQSLFESNNISVIVGAPSLTPEELVENYMNGDLQSGQNVCDH